MSGNRFEFDTGRTPADRPAVRSPEAEPDPHEKMGAAPAGTADGDDQRRDEPADEPGYGHGV